MYSIILTLMYRSATGDAMTTTQINEFNTEAHARSTATYLVKEYKEAGFDLVTAYVIGVA